MSARSASRWVVVKFGGTSVSSLANWRNIALVVRRRLEGGPPRAGGPFGHHARSPTSSRSCWPRRIAGKPDEALQGHRGPAPPANYRAGRRRSARSCRATSTNCARCPMASRWCASCRTARARASWPTASCMATEIGARFLERRASTSPGWMRATCSRPKLAALPPRPRCCRPPVRSRPMRPSSRSSTPRRPW